MGQQGVGSDLELRAIRDAMIAAALRVCAVSVENGFILRARNVGDPKEEITLKMFRKGAEPVPRYVTLIVHHCCCEQDEEMCTVHSHLYGVSSYSKLNERTYGVTAKHLYSVKLAMKASKVYYAPEEVLETIYVKEEFHTDTELVLNRLTAVFGRRNSDYVATVATLTWYGNSPEYLDSIETVIARKIEEE